MKIVSVLMTLGLLAGADQLSIRLKRAGALPVNSEQHLSASPSTHTPPPRHVFFHHS